MVLTKVWLQAEINSEPDPVIKLALERVFLKYTEAPTKSNSNTQTILKDFDADKTYSSVVHYYIDKKNYSKEEAHEVAVRVVNREKERINLK